MNEIENDALSLEYKLYERGTTRHLNVRDLVNNPAIVSIGRPEEGGPKKELIHFLGVNVGPPGDDFGD